VFIFCNFKIMKVLVTGASGFIGRHLINALLDMGYEVIAVSRNIASARKSLPAGVHVIDWETNELRMSVKSSDAIINLAGESISRFPWTKARKRAILNSRILAAQRLGHTLSVIGNWNGTFIQASAIGFYGNQTEKECSELCAAGKGFLAEVCIKWESQKSQLQSLANRLITIRIGVVLGSDGGIFPQLHRQARIHAAGKLGGGKQWMSWIHIYDLVYGILYLLNDANAKGIYNLVAPHPVRQKALSVMMSEIGGTGFQFPAPAFIIRLLLGEFGRELLLNGQKVSAGKLVRQGFIYKYPELRLALNDLYNPYQS
jgi:uncharacterized protein (TIGR01777 family)